MMTTKGNVRLASAVTALWLHSAAVSLADAAAAEGLIVSAVTRSDTNMWKLAFADHGSGAAKDLSVWDVAPAVAAAGWKIVGHAGEGGYGTASSLVVLKAGSDSAALAAPTSLTLNWQWDTTHGGAFFTPVCSTGYTALGSVATDKEATASSKPSDFPGLVCVANKYLTGPTSAKLSNVWTSQGSHHYKMDGSAWSQPALKTEHGEIALPFVAGAASSFSAPTAPRRTIDLSKVQVVAMPKPPPPPPMGSNISPMLPMSWRNALRNGWCCCGSGGSHNAPDPGRGGSWYTPAGPPTTIAAVLIAAGGPVPHAETAGGGGSASIPIWPMAPERLVIRSISLLANLHQS